MGSYKEFGEVDAGIVGIFMRGYFIVKIAPIQKYISGIKRPILSIR
jgi:hypothetical protein